MRRQFCNRTSNFKRFMAAIGALDARGAEEACLIVVDGEPGLGKTTTMEWWAVQTSSVFLRAKKQWTPAWMMRDLIAELDRSPEHAFEANFKQAVSALIARMSHAQATGQSFAIIVDEADHVSRSFPLLETLRDLSDLIEVPIVLVGMGKIRHNLRRFPQVASRVAQYVDFKPASVEDVRAIADTCCEVPIGDDLLTYLQRHANGHVREIKEGLKAIELAGVKRAGQPVTLADMNGKELFNDRKTNAVHVVRAG